MAKKGGKDRARSLRRGRRRGRPRDGSGPGRPPSWLDLGWLPDDGNEADGRTPSGRFVTRLCRHAFLDIWTLPNPVGKKGKELCDCLVVFDEHVIIVSVKDIAYKDTGDHVGFLRWQKDAIDKSVQQIRGAERFLARVDHVEASDGRTVPLPPAAERRYHRLSVSLGGDGKVPTMSVRDDGAPVHLLDERSVGVIFALLPTVADFTGFLEALDALPTAVVMQGGMEDMATLFVRYGSNFCDQDELPHLMIVDEGLFTSFLESPEYRDFRQRLDDAFYWTGLLERWAEDIRRDGDLPTRMRIGDLPDHAPLVQMAREPLSARAVLGAGLRDFLTRSTRVACRVMSPWPDVAYVVLAGSSEGREERGQELLSRCWIVGAKARNLRVVVGVALDRPGTSKVGYAEDIVLVGQPEWTDADEAKADEMIRESGWFSGLDWGPIRERSAAGST